MVLVGAGVGFLCGIVLTLMCVALGAAAKNADAINNKDGGE